MRKVVSCTAFEFWMKFDLIGPLHQVIQACGEEPDANLQANISALLLRRPMITQCITGTDDIVAQQLRERGSNTT